MYFRADDDIQFMFPDVSQAKKTAGMLGPRALGISSHMCPRSWRQEREVHQTQLRVLRDQTSSFVRDLAASWHWNGRMMSAP